MIDAKKKSFRSITWRGQALKGMRESLVHNGKPGDYPLQALLVGSPPYRCVSVWATAGHAIKHNIVPCYHPITGKFVGWSADYWDWSWDSAY